MKSNNKNEGCYNCRFSRGLNDMYSASPTAECYCTETWATHKWDYSCKKWRIQE